jgi:hypothetical protein
LSPICVGMFQRLLACDMPSIARYCLPRQLGRLGQQALDRPPVRKRPTSRRFSSDSVTLHVSREKDGKLRLICSGWDDTKIVQPDRCGQARGAGRVDPTPWQGRAMTPLSKTRLPLRSPLGFSGYRCRSRASNRAFFALVFDPPLCVTVPSPLSVTGAP